MDIDTAALQAAERNAAAALGEESVSGAASAAARPSPSSESSPRVAFLQADFAGLASEAVRRQLNPEGCAKEHAQPC